MGFVQPPRSAPIFDSPHESLVTQLTLISTSVMLIVWLFLAAAAVYLIYLIMKALRKYTKSMPVRKEKDENAKTLGEILKQHRMRCKMTQEFIAETLGVSRQAVSKWENGTAAPSTTNLMAMAKLFGVEAAELLKEAQ